MRRHYKERSSGFRQWDQGPHAKEYLLYPQNLGPHLSIDEVELTQGDYYTFLTNKAAGGGKGAVVACINGTTTKKLIHVLSMLPQAKREQVQEVTMDMAPSMEAAVSEVFTNAKRVTDRFHVAKLAIDAIQRVRIDLRWMELDKENAAIAQARKERKPYKSQELANYETPKQLLARLRTTLMKTTETHNVSQTLRRSIAFQRYPQLERAYNHGMRLRNIFEERDRQTAAQKLGEWISETFDCSHEAFYSVARTIEAHRENILNYFNRRATNASAESFNAKLKLFRANQRGVQDLNFFLFRIEKLFA